MARRFNILGVLAWLCLAALPVAAQETKERIAYQRDGLNKAPTDIVVMYADGTHPVDLAPHNDLAGPRVTPALASDGRTIAFAAKVGNAYKLFTWKLDEQNGAIGAPVRLTRDEDVDEKFPAWSLDGKQIAYLAIDRQNATTLRVINVDGTGRKVLAETRLHATPSWKPDGQQLIYIDIENKNPVLMNIPATGGVPVPIRRESRITAACYSPDGSKIAALIKRADEYADLWVIRPFGIGGEKIVEKISGCKAISWNTPESITFNGVSVAGQTGKPFWRVSPTGEGLRGISAYAAAKQISFFSLQKGDLTPYLPTALDPNSPAGPDGRSGAPIERVSAGPVTIRRPLADTTVNGLVPIKILARKEVTSIVIRIGEKFAFATAVSPEDVADGTISYLWDTQQLNEVDPVRGGLPARYQQMVAYPDGPYTLTVIAMDENNAPVGKDTIAVRLQNNLAESEFPENLRLQYRYTTNDQDEQYQVSGKGLAFGAAPGQAGNLAAQLEALLRRSVIDVRPNGTVEMRTYLREPDGHYALVAGAKERSIPEAQVSALYALTPSGELSVIPQQREKVFQPLAQLALPLPLTPVSNTTRWTTQMWIVPDLLTRQALPVRASHAIDGIELIGGRKTVRIRSDFAISAPGNEYLLPTTMIKTYPGLYTAKPVAAPAAGVQPMGMGGMGAVTETPPGDGIKVRDTAGIRYTWFDYEKGKIVRVEDLLLYSFPASLLPGSTAEVKTDPAAGGTFGAGAGGLGMGGGAAAGGGRGTRGPTAWYLVRLSYTKSIDALVED